MANWLQQAIKLLTRSETIRAGLFFFGGELASVLSAALATQKRRTPAGFTYFAHPNDGSHNKGGLFLSESDRDTNRRG